MDRRILHKSRGYPTSRSVHIRHERSSREGLAEQHLHTSRAGNALIDLHVKIARRSDVDSIEFDKEWPDTVLSGQVDPIGLVAVLDSEIGVHLFIEYQVPVVESGVESVFVSSVIAPLSREEERHYVSLDAGIVAVAGRALCLPTASKPDALYVEELAAHISLAGSARNAAIGLPETAGRVWHLVVVWRERSASAGWVEIEAGQRDRNPVRSGLRRNRA